jgi:hypothetical protein
MKGFTASVQELGFEIQLESLRFYDREIRAADSGMFRLELFFLFSRGRSLEQWLVHLRFEKHHIHHHASGFSGNQCVPYTPELH